MTIEELDAYIKDYTKNDKTNRAVMLTAPWGSGKTYYIKNELVPSLKKDGIGTILVSLYGIESLAELSKNLYIEAMAKWINKKSEKEKLEKLSQKLLLKMSLAITELTYLLMKKICKSYMSPSI